MRLDVSNSLGGKRTLAHHNREVAFQRLDERASGVIPVIASPDCRRQRALHPPKIGNARAHVAKMDGGEIASLGATFVPACGEVEQCANLLDRETQFARSADEAKSCDISAVIGPVAALPERHGQQADPLVIADGFDVHPGALGQLADGNGRRLHRPGFLKKIA